MEDCLPRTLRTSRAYKTFLEQKGTGIFRMYPNPGCWIRPWYASPGSAPTFVLVPNFGVPASGKSLISAITARCCRHSAFFRVSDGGPWRCRTFRA